MCKKLPYENPRIDECLLDEISVVHEAGYRPVASCCGHGKYPRTIVVIDLNGVVHEWYSGALLKKQKRNRYYKRDKDGYYYLNPEVYA